jgi:hypothetical protein
MEHVIALYLRKMWDKKIKIDVSKAFNSVPNKMFKKTATSRVYSRVVVWIREFPSGLTQRVRVGGQFLQEVVIMSRVLQGSALGPVLSSNR